MSLDDIRFTLSAPTFGALPEDAGREVVFAGRSNAGKSSAINAAFNRRGLARVSHQPGRTQAFNVFEVDADRRLVDLPGYGYAAVPERVRRRWAGELPRYFAERRALAGIIVVMDLRHPFKAIDGEFLALARPDTPLAVILTKSDKLPRGQRAKQLARARREAAAFGVDPEQVIGFSAETREGVPAVRALLEAWLDLPGGEAPADRTCQ